VRVGKKRQRIEEGLRVEKSRVGRWLRILKSLRLEKR